MNQRYLGHLQIYFRLCWRCVNLWNLSQLWSYNIVRKRDDPNDEHTNDILIHKLHENMVKLKTVPVGSDKLLLLRTLVGRQFPGDTRDCENYAYVLHWSLQLSKKVTSNRSYDESSRWRFLFMTNLLSCLMTLLTDNNYAYFFKIIGTAIIPILRSIQDRRSVLDN